MSAQGQERKEAGATAPVTPQKPEGGFSRFLRKLFDVPSESQQTQQSAPRIIQPPPGLEDFAAQIQQGVDGHLSAQRQQELDRKNAEAVRLTAEAAQREQAEASQRALEEKRAAAQAEAQGIMRDLQVEERLRYIQATIWEGKGKIQPIESRVDLYGNGILGGLELIYSFPSCARQVDDSATFSEGINGLESHSRLRARWAPVIGSTRLIVRVSSRNLKVGCSKEIEIYADFDGGDLIPEIPIPLEAEDRNILLEKAFVEDSQRRIARGLPSVVENRARERLALAKKSDNWMKWKEVPRGSSSKLYPQEHYYNG